MKTYYYVYRVKNQIHKIKHPTIEKAYEEAMRLAGQHPGDAFEILQCLATVMTTQPKAFWMDGVVPPHVCNEAVDADSR